MSRRGRLAVSAISVGWSFSASLLAVSDYLPAAIGCLVVGCVCAGIVVMDERRFR
jgi:hypothetical protein